MISYTKVYRRGAYFLATQVFPWQEYIYLSVPGAGHNTKCSMDGRIEHIHIKYTEEHMKIYD